MARALASFRDYSWGSGSLKAFYSEKLTADLAAGSVRFTGGSVAAKATGKYKPNPGVASERAFDRGLSVLVDVRPGADDDEREADRVEGGDVRGWRGHA